MDIPGLDQSHYNQSHLYSRLQTKLAQFTRTTPKWIYAEYIALKTFSPFSIFEQLALALKNRVFPEILHCIGYILFIIQDFWATCACPDKQIWSEIIHCIEISFIIQDFWATYVCPEIFHSIEYTFHIQNFWATCACPEKQSCPEIFHCFEIYFIIQEFWATCACLEDRSLHWNFSLDWNIFYHSGILNNLRLPWKQNLP